MQHDLESRVARLEAIHEIRSLKMRYVRWCGAGYEVGAVGQLFTDTSVWDGGETFGRYEGGAAIREFFTRTGGRVDWTLHYIVSGDISVGDDLRTAQASWYLWQPMTLEGEPVWHMATYDDDYVLTDGGWRFDTLKLTVHAVTNIHKGWVDERFIDHTA